MICSSVKLCSPICVIHLKVLVVILVYVTALPQYETTKAYMPKEPDELSLQQAEVVIVLQEVDGKDSLQNFFRFVNLMSWRDLIYLSDSLLREEISSPLMRKQTYYNAGDLSYKQYLRNRA